MIGGTDESIAIIASALTTLAANDGNGWAHVPLPSAQLHPIQAEAGALAAAEDYCRQLAVIDHIDIALPGLGEDGHTASLFPDNPALSKLTTAVPVFDAPKPPSARISLSIQTLQRAGERIILAAGNGKSDAISRINAGKPLPAAMIGEALWFLDEAAMAGLTHA